MAFRISPQFLTRVATLESGGDPRAKNPNSSAKGLYQFTKRTARAYGLSDPFDPIASTAAFKTLTADNYGALKKKLGREPTEAELYLAHQQGADGAAKLIKNPNTPAAELVGIQQVKNNGGDASMTAADFANMWKDKYDATPHDQIAVNYGNGGDGYFPAGTPDAVIRASLDQKRQFDAQNGEELTSLGKYGDDPIGMGAGEYLAQRHAAMADPLAMVADSGQIKTDANSEMLDFSEHAEAPDFSQDADPVGGLKNNNVAAPLDTSKIRTAVDNFNQGTTMGWGNEITDPLAALYAALANDPMAALKGEVNDPALAEQLVGLRENSQKTLAAGREENPWTAGVSQVGGALTGALAASKLIPNAAATRLTNIAKAAPNITAGAVGGGSSVINSLGEAEGTGLDRFDNVGMHDLLGVGAGIGGYQLAKAGGRAVNALSERFGPRIKDAMGGILGEADPIMPRGAPPVTEPLDLSPTKLAGILDDEDAAKLATGRVLPMTAGQRTQDVKIQQMENIARESGSKPFLKAASAQQDATYKPLTSILGDNQQLDPIALNHRTQDEMQGAAGILRDQYDQLGQRVNKAYDTAAQGAGGVAIKAGNINDDFLGKVSDTLAIENVRAGDIPKLDANLSELTEILNPPEGATTTAVKLDKLEAWKKRLNRTIGNTAEPADARIVKMVGRHYDDFMSNLADDAIVNGDQSAIQAFKDARGLASQKFKFYDSDKAVQKILDNRELSGTHLVNTILGANKLAGKGDDGRIVETMLNLAGDKAPEMQNAMRRGVLSKVLNESLSPTIDPVTKGTAAERNMLDFGKMKRSLGSLMQQRETFGALFDDTEQAYFKQMYKDISDISSHQVGSINPSGTGSRVANLVMGIGKIANNPLFAKLSLGTSLYAKKGLESYAETLVTGKAEKGLGEFIANAFKQIDAPAVFYGGYMGSQSSDPIGNIVFGGENDSNQH